MCKVPLWPWDILMVNWAVKVICSENLKSAIVYIHHFGRYRNPVYPYMRLSTQHCLGAYLKYAKSRCGREITSWPTEPSKIIHFHNKSEYRYITKVWRFGRYRNPVYPYMRFYTHHGLVQVLAGAKSRCGREITSWPTEPSKMAIFTIKVNTVT